MRFPLHNALIHHYKVSSGLQCQDTILRKPPLNAGQGRGFPGIKAKLDIQVFPSSFSVFIIVSCSVYQVTSVHPDSPFQACAAFYPPDVSGSAHTRKSKRISDDVTSERRGRASQKKKIQY